MRLVLKIVICLALWFCFACEQEQNMPIEGDFSIAMVDDNYNVPAQVRIINKITGADAFQWEFPNGSYTSSNAFYPEDIRYTKENRVLFSCPNAKNTAIALPSQAL